MKGIFYQKKLVSKFIARTFRKLLQILKELIEQILIELIKQILIELIKQRWFIFFLFVLISLISHLKYSIRDLFPYPERLNNYIGLSTKPVL
jgi:hypothetical protein